MGLRVVARNRYLGSFIGDPGRGEVLDHRYIPGVDRLRGVDGRGGAPTPSDSL